MRWVVLIVVVSLVGCAPKPVSDNNRVGSGRRLRTVEHEGHKFITYDSYHGVDFEHHPDCPCFGSRPPVMMELKEGEDGLKWTEPEDPDV